MQRAAAWAISISTLAFTGCASIDTPKWNSPAKPTTGMPGETLGNALLQYDTKMPVFIAATRKMTNEDCPDNALTLHDTKVLSQPKEMEGRAVYTSWRELWTVRGCDESVDVEVTYMQHFLEGVTIYAR